MDSPRLGPGALGLGTGFDSPRGLEPRSDRPPVPSDDAVQGTHVDAALAKISCAQKGYFEDRWTEQLIRKNSSSTGNPDGPTMRRGYYARVAGMRNNVVRFLAGCPAKRGAQVVALGAGFDTTYFWLRENPTLWRDDLTYFEVDFPEILSKKVSAVLKRQALWPLMDAASKEDIVSPELNLTGTRDLRTKHLRYVQADMRLKQELITAMGAAGFRSDVPTIFLSECVLVYMQASAGDSIIEWAASAVPDAPSAIVVYEQTSPNDKFGQVMVQNFERRGCPLQGIHDYPSMPSQRDRYLQQGWQKCVLVDMCQVYYKHLDAKDVERIQKIPGEQMDEFEQWHFLMAHYFLLVATRAPSGEGGATASEHAWIHEVPIFAAAAAAAAAVPGGSSPRGGGLPDAS